MKIDFWMESNDHTGSTTPYVILNHFDVTCQVINIDFNNMESVIERDRSFLLCQIIRCY